MSQKPRSVVCPNCGNNVLWTPDNVWRPFCSERCKLIDFGAWATERYCVAVLEDNDPDEDAVPGAGQ
jgi:uncharacterized protein